MASRNVALWLKSHDLERGFYWYVTAMIGVSLVVYLFMRETRDHTLIEEH